MGCHSLAVLHSVTGNQTQVNTPWLNPVSQTSTVLK